MQLSLPILKDSTPIVQHADIAHPQSLWLQFIAWTRGSNCSLSVVTLFLPVTGSTFNKHPMGCKAQLAWKCLFTLTFFPWATFIHKVGQTDLVSGMQLAFVSGFVHVRSQVSVCSGLRFIPPWLTSTHRQHFDQLTSKAQIAELKSH